MTDSLLPIKLEQKIFTLNKQSLLPRVMKVMNKIYNNFLSGSPIRGPKGEKGVPGKNGSNESNGSKGYEGLKGLTGFPGGLGGKHKKDL